MRALPTVPRLLTLVMRTGEVRKYFMAATGCLVSNKFYIKKSVIELFLKNIFFGRVAD